jgi:hypothetical protein
VCSKIGMATGMEFTRKWNLALEPAYVLNELIIALMRKGTLTDEEDKTVLSRLVHRELNIVQNVIILLALRRPSRSEPAASRGWPASIRL